MKARYLALLAVFCGVLLLAAPAPARADGATPPAAGQFSPAQRAEIVAIVRAALKADPGILRDAIAALQQDEAQQHDAAARATIGERDGELTRRDGDPTAGARDGDVTLVEFYDLRCPYCRRMLPVMAELLQDEPHLRVVYKDIPILGPGSTLGARAVLAAQRQGGYAKLQEAIMQGPAQITEDSLHEAAARAGLDWPSLRRDMDDPAIAARIEGNLALARTLNVDGTPAYVVGGRMIPGAVSLSALRDAVAQARKQHG